MTHPVILETCRQHMVRVDDFFSQKRNGQLMRCRVDAARILRERGNSWVVVGRIVGRSRDTVRYWLDMNVRNTRKAYMLKRWHSFYKYQPNYKGGGVRDYHL